MVLGLELIPSNECTNVFGLTVETTRLDPIEPSKHLYHLLGRICSVLEYLADLLHSCLDYFGNLAEFGFGIAVEFETAVVGMAAGNLNTAQTFLSIN